MSADIKTLLRRGLSAHEGNRPDEAEKIYRRALAMQPGHPEAEHLLATLLTTQDRAIEALELFESCLPRLGANPAVRCNYAIALEQAGQTENAIDQFRQAISFHGDFPTALYHLGRLEMPRGHLGQTVDLLGRLLGLKPDHFDGLLLFGEALHALGQEEAALAALERAANAAAISPAHICKVAALLLRLAYPELAQNLYQRALSIDPRDGASLQGLGHSLAAQGQYAKAVAILRAALQLGADGPDGTQGADTALAIAHISMECGDFSGAGDILADLARRFPQRGDIALAMQDLTARQSNTSGADYLKGARIWAQSHLPAPESPRFANSAQTERRLRIGWLSPHFCSDAASDLLMGLARNLDRKETELFLYSATARPDERTRAWQVMADGWREVYGQSPRDIAERIRKDRIDILFDLTGPVAGQPMAVFALRAAPVQASLARLSTGIGQMDHIVLNQHEIPPRPVAGKLLSEKPVTLAAGPLSMPATLTDPGSALTLLPAAISDQVTFGCLDRPGHISDESLICFARISNKLRNSRLILQDERYDDVMTRNVMLERARQAGLHHERIEMIGTVRPHDRPALFGRIDIALAPFPMMDIARYYDMLWHGIPFVTLAGELPASRAGLALLAAVGLDALAAETDKGYVDKALLLGNDVAALTTVRSRMRERLQASKIMAPSAIARDFEEACRDMWKGWCAR